MKFVDLEFENKLAAENSTRSFSVIETSAKYLLGDFLSKFEDQFSVDQNVKHSICVKNATDALYMTFKILNSENRTVIVPNFGAYPTVIAAIQSGAKKIIAAPVDESLTIDLSNVEVPMNSIIVHVHLFGIHANMKQIEEIASATDSLIIEDCAQSTGLPKSKKSIAAIHSFYPTKPLGCRGDGGSILTDNDELERKLRKARFYGINNAGVIDSWGFNSRMDEWQSAFLLQKLLYYKSNNVMRQKNAAELMKVFNAGITFGNDCVFHQFVSLWSDREQAISELNNQSIPTMVHYPKMLHDMLHLQDKVTFTIKQKISDHILSFPVGPHLLENDIAKIQEAILSIKKNAIRFEEIS